MGTPESDFHDCPDSFYRQIYFEAIGLSITSITNQFDQPGFKVYFGLEQLLFKACKGEDYQLELSAACEFNGEELSRQSLESPLKDL